MISEVLNDKSIQHLLAKKSGVISPEYYAEHDCLYITGATQKYDYAQVFINVDHADFDTICTTLTFTTGNDNSRTNTITWTYGDYNNKPIITKMILLLIEDVVESNGGAHAKVLWG